MAQTPPNPDVYGYLPSEPAALFGVSFFSISMIVCIIQVIFGRYRHYWMLTIALAALGESLGWGARLWAHFAPTDWMPFMIQICSLVVSPILISAADYILYCKLLDHMGPRLFLIRSRFFWVGFIVADLVALTIQIVGGVLISSALNYKQLAHGASVARSGIIFQLSNTVVFVVLIFATILRLWAKGTTLISVAGWPMTIAMCLSTLMVLIRNSYRIVELSDGWNSHFMRTEGFLIGLDLAPMAVAVGAFVVFSPSLFWRGKDEVVLKSVVPHNVGHVMAQKT